MYERINFVRGVASIPTTPLRWLAVKDSLLKAAGTEALQATPNKPPLRVLIKCQGNTGMSEDIERVKVKDKRQELITPGRASVGQH